MPAHALETIGAITVQSGVLEAEITRLIAFTASPSHPLPVEFLVHADPLSAKLDKLKILTRLAEVGGTPVLTSVSMHWPEDLRGRVRDFVARVERGREDRNHVVHSRWMVRDDDQFTYLRDVTSGRSKMRYLTEEWTQERLEAVLAALVVAVADAGRLWVDLFRHWAAVNPERVATIDDAVVLGTGEIIRGDAADLRGGPHEA